MTLSLNTYKMLAAISWLFVGVLAGITAGVLFGANAKQFVFYLTVTVGPVLLVLVNVLGEKKVREPVKKIESGEKKCFPWG